MRTKLTEINFKKCVHEFETDSDIFPNLRALVKSDINFHHCGDPAGVYVGLSVFGLCLPREHKLQ